MQLKEIATIKTGVVIARKKAKPIDIETFEYPAITLKSFSEEGRVNHNHLDSFISKVSLESKYFTQESDIVVRLREPIIALHIDKSDENLLIPSLMAVIKVDPSTVNSRFLAYYLNSKVAQRDLSTSIRGTTINMIQTKVLGELTIDFPPLARQKKMANYLDLAHREMDLLEALKKERAKETAELFNRVLLNKE